MSQPPALTGSTGAQRPLRALGPRGEGAAHTRRIQADPGGSRRGQPRGTMPRLFLAVTADQSGQELTPRPARGSGWGVSWGWVTRSAEPMQCTLGVGGVTRPAQCTFAAGFTRPVHTLRNARWGLGVAQGMLGLGPGWNPGERTWLVSPWRLLPGGAGHAVRGAQTRAAKAGGRHRVRTLPTAAGVRREGGRN